MDSHRRCLNHLGSGGVDEMTCGTPAQNVEGVDIRGIAARALTALVIATCAAVVLGLAGCAAIQPEPGYEYPWVTVTETRSMDGVSEATMGVGRRF